MAWEIGMENRIEFLSDGNTIEGLQFRQPNASAGAVICHPHPLYGGDMHNPVVECIAKAYQKKGFSTLRFNFRGVGRSQGTYDDGKGEVRDVISAIGVLKNSGHSVIHLAGYSFGAWIISMIDLREVTVDRMIMVSPPVAMIPFDTESADIPNLGLVVTGSLDEIAPLANVKDMMGKWNSSAIFEIIPGADHFYWGFDYKLQTIIFEYLYHESN